MRAMTDPRPGFVCLLRRGPQTEPSPEWEAGRHAHEVGYWAEHLDEFVSFLPGIRRRRGDERARALVGDVLTAIRGTEGQDAAVLARDRLMDVWRGEKPRWRL